MPASTICSRCGRVTRERIDGRCPPCARVHEQERTRERLLTEPWRRVYQTRQWWACRRAAFKRDGHRCRVVEDNERCPVTKGLHAHHHPEALEELYQRARNWETFVILATDIGAVVTTCARHNNMLDAERRRNR